MDPIHLLQLDWSVAGRIALAALLGGLFGLERDIHGHEAGLRTNMMIAISSCLFTILSIEAFPVVGGSRDTARIAAQIVVGVGFLGAGTMLQTKNKVRGLTTAATIWLVAAIGMAVGTGAYTTAIFTAVLAFVVLVLLAPVSARLAERARMRSGASKAGQARKKPLGGEEHEERHWEEETERGESQT
jgi:putative Mg2+ transporter-C (MgtC) family protein